MREHQPVDEREHAAMLDHDERHWWYRGRRAVLRAELDRLPPPPGGRVLDAGCGSGRTLDDLVAYGSVAGLDASPAAVELARGRGHPDARVGSLEALPWPDRSFGLVTCLDVIEHTDDDRAVLGELRRVTVPEGRLVVTVPAYPALWSSHDVVNRHRRRYTRRTLRAALSGGGWTLERMTSFNALLLAPAAVLRIAERAVGRGADRARSDLELTPSRLDGLLAQPMRLEAGWLARGGSLPVGLSLLAVARRTPGARE